MVRVISLFQNKSGRPVFTKTILQNAAWNTGVIVALYLLFNFFTIKLLDVQLEHALDHSIEHEIEHFENVFKFEGDSMIILNPMEFNESDLTQITESPFFLQIYRPNGEILIQSRNMALFGSIVLESPEFGSSEFILKTIENEKETLRSGFKKITNKSGKYVAILQLSTFKSTALIISHRLLLFNLISFPIILLIIILVSILIARKSFSPINKIIDLANNITARNLTQRLEFEADPNDELGRLRDTLNNLLKRLQNQIIQITHFTDNASHQLMSPLTILKTELEYITNNLKSNVCDDSIFILQDQTERMIHIIQTLLILAKEGRENKIQSEVFDLNSLIDENIRPLYKKEQIQYQLTDDVLLRGNKDYFELVLQNLINNAIKYSNGNISILLKVVLEKQSVRIDVSDQGIGIFPEERDLIFDRFYRGKHIERSGVDGVGLGLSLVYSIVSSMGGVIEVRENKPSGTIFSILLPQLKFE